MAQHRAGELGEEAFDQVEPRTMLRRKGELEAFGRLGIEPGPGFLGDVRGVIIQDQLNRGVGRISGIEKFEEFDELSAAMAVSDESVDLAGEQIDPSQQAERTMAFVLIIASQ